MPAERVIMKVALFLLIPILFAIYAIASTLHSLSTGIARVGLS